MSSFTVRVELHQANSGDYDTLHEKMEKAGFSREVAGTDASGLPGVWALPTAEYDFTDSARTAQEVRDMVKGIADGVKAGSWVLVTEVKSRSWNTKKIRSG